MKLIMLMIVVALNVATSSSSYHAIQPADEDAFEQKTPSSSEQSGEPDEEVSCDATFKLAQDTYANVLADYKQGKSKCKKKLRGISKKRLTTCLDKAKKAYEDGKKIYDAAENVKVDCDAERKKCKRWYENIIRHFQSRNDIDFDSKAEWSKCKAKSTEDAAEKCKRKVAKKIVGEPKLKQELKDKLAWCLENADPDKKAAAAKAAKEACIERISSRSFRRRYAHAEKEFQTAKKMFDECKAASDDCFKAAKRLQIAIEDFRKQAAACDE